MFKTIAFFSIDTTAWQLDFAQLKRPDTLSPRKEKLLFTVHFELTSVPVKCKQEHSDNENSK